MQFLTSTIVNNQQLDVIDNGEMIMTEVLVMMMMVVVVMVLVVVVEIKVAIETSALT